MTALFRKKRSLEQTPEPAHDSSEDFSSEEKKWFAEFDGKNPYAKPEIRAKLAASDKADAEYRARMKASEPKKMKEPNRLAKFLGIGVLRNWEKEAAWLEQQDEMNRERAERIAAEHTVEQSLDSARAETQETGAVVAEARGIAAEGSPAATRLDALGGAAEKNASDLESAGRNAKARMIEDLRPVDPRTVSVDRLNQLLDEEEAADDDTLAYGENGHMPFETRRPEEAVDAEREEDDDQMEDTGVIDAEDDSTKAKTEIADDTDEEKPINAKELLDQIDTGGNLVDVVQQLASLEALNTSKTSGRHNVERLISELKGELEGEGYEFDETGAMQLGDDRALYKNSADEGRVKLLQGLYELQELESSLHKQTDESQTRPPAEEGKNEEDETPKAESDPVVENAQGESMEEENPKEVALKNIKAELLTMFKDDDNDGVHYEVLAGDILHSDFVLKDPKLALEALSDSATGLREGLLKRGIRVSEEGTVLLEKGSAPEQNPKSEKHKKTIDWLNAFIVAKEKLERQLRNQDDKAIAYGEDENMPFETPKSLDERIKLLTLRVENMKKTTKKPHEGLKRRIAELEEKLEALKLKKTKETPPHKATEPEPELSGADKPRKTKRDDVRALGEEIQKLDIKEVAERHKRGLGLIRQSEPKRKAGAGRDDLQKAA